MPDVRCACATRVSARQALSHSDTSSALFRHPPPSQIGSGHQGARSGSPDPGPPSIARRRPCLTAQRRARTTNTADSSDLALPGSSCASTGRTFVDTIRLRVPAWRRRSPSTRERRGNRNAQLRLSCHIAINLARPTKRRHHPEAFRGAGALNVVLASRPFLTCAPNPGMQRTRCARR